MNRRAFAAAAFVLLVLAPGCAYYNTFYSAKKNFAKAENLSIKPDDPANAQQVSFYDKAALSAGKVVTDYSKSKWVDDALLMDEALAGVSPPLQFRFGKFPQRVEQFRVVRAHFAILSPQFIKCLSALLIAFQQSGGLLYCFRSRRFVHCGRSFYHTRWTVARFLVGGIRHFAGRA